jgi:DNA-binding NarL/FixJ family response regulator
MGLRNLSMGDHQALTPPWQINVLIVDDHPIMREGLRKVLELEADIKIVAEAETGEQALDIAARIHPDVVLLDINLPELNGLQVTARIKNDHKEIGVILLTAYDDVEQIVHAMRVGASAYCPKDIRTERLVEVIRQVARGSYVIGEKTYNERGIKDWLNNQVRDLSGPHVLEDSEPYMPLSTREMEILRCVTRGLSNKQIALELGISHQTVKNHMTSILDKLHVGGRTQAAVYALKHGWVRPEEYRRPSDEQGE